MRPVLILAIFLINFTGLKGQTTEISEMTDEGISAKGMEWRQHGNANTHEFKDTMEVTRRSFWQSITRKFQEWESTSMSYLEKDRSISPEDTTNISINMMDNARGITRKFQEWVTASMLRLQMNQSEEFDLTTHFPNDMVEKAQDSWQNRTRNVQPWPNISRSHLESNVSSEEISMDGRYRGSTRATAYGHDYQMRYLQNATYEKEPFSEEFFRSPNNVSTYQYDRWANDTFSVGNMNLSVRYYSEQMTRSPEWFQNNTMNNWENETRPSLVTNGYFSNGSTSDVAPQTSQMWNMSIHDVNAYPETISNTTSMGSIEINTTGQTQTTVSRHAVNTKMYSHNSHTSQVEFWNMTASTTPGYDILKVTSHQSDNSESTTNDTSVHSSETSGGMNDTSMNDGTLVMNESLTRRLRNETSETSRGMNDTPVNDGSLVMNESLTIQLENETSETFGGMNDTSVNDGNLGMNESLTIRLETSGGMNDTSMNDGSLVKNDSFIIRLENETSGGMNGTYVNDGNVGMNESLTIQLEIWNVIGSPPSTTSTPVVTHDDSESTINDTSVHRNRTRLCLTKNNLTKDCVAADSGE